MGSQRVYEGCADDTARIINASSMNVLLYARLSYRRLRRPAFLMHFKKLHRHVIVKLVIYKSITDTRSLHQYLAEQRISSQWDRAS